MFFWKNIIQLKYFVLISVFSLFAGYHASAQSQYGVNDTIVHEAIIYNGDTIELKTLSNLYC